MKLDFSLKLFTKINQYHFTVLGIVYFGAAYGNCQWSSGWFYDKHAVDMFMVFMTFIAVDSCER